MVVQTRHPSSALSLREKRAARFGSMLARLDIFSFGFVWSLESRPLCSPLQQVLLEALPGGWSCHFVHLLQAPLVSSGWIWAAVNFAGEAAWEVETGKTV